MGKEEEKGRKEITSSVLGAPHPRVPLIHI
jgi:hypothetical protein